MSGAGPARRSRGPLGEDPTLRESGAVAAREQPRPPVTAWLGAGGQGTPSCRSKGTCGLLGAQDTSSHDRVQTPTPRLSPPSPDTDLKQQGQGSGAGPPGSNAADRTSAALSLRRASACASADPDPLLPSPRGDGLRPEQQSLNNTLLKTRARGAGSVVGNGHVHPAQVLSPTH